MQQILITDAPDQRLSVVMNGQRCTLRMRFNTLADRWFLDLAIDDAPIITGRKMVLNIDLLEPFDLGLGSLFLAAEVEGAQPGRFELPDGSVRLYHATPDEIAAA
ncbi:phage baseplate plug family protein [Aureimonas ureilytica]|uniref:phage baseplate plug family protein n=1 Tax=Aureimonas ureilytica TaxID=401562 RepID=UPI000372F7D2|nr:hypothetical protein [Aureimonas ureilytica]